MLRIAYLTCVFPPYPGGIGVAAAGMAKEMAGRGYAVEVFTPRPRNHTQTIHERSCNFAYTVRGLIPLLRYGNAAILLQLLWCLRRFDIVHVYYPFFGGAEIAILARNIWKFKLVLHHEMDVVGEGIMKKIFSWHTRRILPWILKNTDCVCVLSDDYFINSDFGSLFQKIGKKFPLWKVVPNGVDTDLFKPAHDGHLEHSEEFHASLEGRDHSPPKAYQNDIISPTILLVSGLDRAHYFKGVHILIKALRILTDREINYTCEIIGEGDMKTEYERHVQQAGLQKHVKFVGLIPHEKLVEVYRRGTACVVPSTERIESFSIVAAEAQACGLPVIVSDLPGVRVTIEPEVTGLKVRPGDPEDLAQKLETLLTNADMAHRMGEAGRKRAAELYSWTVIGDKTEKIYENLHHS